MKKSTPVNVVGETVKPLARAHRPEKGVAFTPSERKRTAADGNGGSHHENGEADLREVLRALTALKKGDFSVRLPVDWLGTSGKVADAFNDVAELMEG